jgi:hypothetical protein
VLASVRAGNQVRASLTAALVASHRSKRLRLARCCILLRRLRHAVFIRAAGRTRRTKPDIRELVATNFICWLSRLWEAHTRAPPCSLQIAQLKCFLFLLLTRTGNPIISQLAAIMERYVQYILPDLLQSNLSVIFCGTAAGTFSAEEGEYYAHSNNFFWSILHETGLTP